jgi:hypothetical protein
LNGDQQLQETQWREELQMKDAEIRRLRGVLRIHHLGGMKQVSVTV